MRVQSKKEIRVLRRQRDKATQNYVRTGDENYMLEWNALDDALCNEWFIPSKRG